MSEAPGTDIAYLHSTLQQRQQYAAALAAAGDLVPSGFRDRNGAANPAKLLLAFETGAMLGLHPLAALQGIHVIEGKPTISAGLMSGLVRAKGHRLRIKATGTIEGNDYAVTATLIRKDDPEAPFTATWTIDRARRAELFGKGSWRKYPEAMLEARAISEVCRKGAQDALSGLTYTPEEIGAEVNADGEVIDGEIVEDEPREPHPITKAFNEAAAKLAPERKPKGDTGNRGHASETRVNAGPDAHATPDGASRPGPSRPPKAAGRPTTEPVTYRSGNPARTGDDWLADIMATQDVEALRLLWARITEAHAANLPTRAGMTVAEAKDARKEALQEAAELPPALDGLDEEPV